MVSQRTRGFRAAWPAVNGLSRPFVPRRYLMTRAPVGALYREEWFVSAPCELAVSGRLEHTATARTQREGACRDPGLSARARGNPDALPPGGPPPAALEGKGRGTWVRRCRR